MPHKLPPDLTLRPVSAAATRSLRGAVLRPGQPPERNVYPYDDSGRDFHGGAYVAGELVGVASVFREGILADDQPGSWRLRGMVVDPTWHRRGIGRALLQFCLNHVVREQGRLLWCHARLTAVPFYEKLGWRAISPVFDVPHLGPHRRMRLDLDRPTE
ncbi:MAG: GNAT family N-acetyltransferase [Candidatus Promineifilaceae bacterium]|nr:GNAT family N-acetyltransferase [Candidatus Promineifilaceae bacterium]